MSQDWMILVLDDLETFARANDMPALAHRLNDARLMAEQEIRRKAKPPPSGRVAPEIQRLAEPRSLRR